MTDHSQPLTVAANGAIALQGRFMGQHPSLPSTAQLELEKAIDAQMEKRRETAGEAGDAIR